MLFYAMLYMFFVSLSRFSSKSPATQEYIRKAGVLFKKIGLI